LSDFSIDGKYGGIDRKYWTIHLERFRLLYSVFVLSRDPKGNTSKMISEWLGGTDDD